VNCLRCSSTVVLQHPASSGFLGASAHEETKAEVTVAGKGDEAAPQGERGAGLEAALEAETAAGEQGLLFNDDVSPLPADVGYRGPTACSAAGITYRQLDYWARTGLVEPTVRGATGSGTQRLYSFRDILILKVIKRLLDAGISLQQIRIAVQHLRERGTDDLTRVTLMSDGASVYECTSNDEVIDLLQGGQGVFGIAIGGVWREIEGSLSDLPSEKAGHEEAPPTTDELSARRRAKATG
jgi:DNA-binding transcriptional MerR regulator